VEQLGRTLDIGEEERDGPGGKFAPHVSVMIRRCWRRVQSVNSVQSHGARSAARFGIDAGDLEF
jgi:hypothetical protein